MSAGACTAAHVGKQPRIEPKKLGTLTEGEAFWHPIFLATFASVLLFGGLTRWISVVGSAFGVLALAVAGIGYAVLVVLKAPSMRAEALDGLRAAVASKDSQRIRIAICRAAVLGVTVREASAVKKVQSALGGAGTRVSCAGKVTSINHVRQEQRLVSCETRAAEPTCSGRSPGAAAVACVSTTEPSNVVLEAPARVEQPSPPKPAEAEPTPRLDCKQMQEVWLDGDVTLWLLL